mmetsp:Transcript_81290/g.143352  ORF Transcript_81290/g.143352 Transcript_81290/m.143352 type:complete len:268 (-) Transcript_81290:1673-2476(-)
MLNSIFARSRSHFSSSSSSSSASLGLSLASFFTCRELAKSRSAGGFCLLPFASFRARALLLGTAKPSSSNAVVVRSRRSRHSTARRPWCASVFRRVMLSFASHRPSCAVSVGPHMACFRRMANRSKSDSDVLERSRRTWPRDAPRLLNSVGSICRAVHLTSKQVVEGRPGPIGRLERRHRRRSKMLVDSSWQASPCFMLLDRPGAPMMMEKMWRTVSRIAQCRGSSSWSKKSAASCSLSEVAVSGVKVWRQRVSICRRPQLPPALLR